MINKIPSNPRLGLVNIGKLTADKFNQLLQYQTPITLTDESIIKWNITKGYNAKVTLKGNRTLRIDQLIPGDYGTLEVIQDGTGNRTLTLPTGSKVGSGGAGAVTLTTTASAIDILSFYYNGTTLYWNITKNFT